MTQSTFVAYLNAEIIASEIQVEPPQKVGVSLQLLQAAKSRKQTLMYREFCHADGLLAIYARVKKELVKTFEQLFRAICYWGRADSFATCINIKKVRKPNLSNVMQPLQNISDEQRLVDLECGIALQMTKNDLSWEDLYDEKKLTKSLRKAIISFGLEIIERHSTHRLLRRRSLE